ncbi:PorP/SprF family type IX secretion system membrane protein, partial [Tenacibaculum finnmarkense]
ATERQHLFFIAGYVFNLSDNIKFKPAALAKAVKGAPLSVDVSANFMFNEKFIAGLAWRWDDSVSALLGFQASEKLYIGFAYDLTTSNYSNYNSGTYEVMLRYEMLKEHALKSPRFF